MFLALGLTAAAAPLWAQTRVDHTAWQTPIRNQGGRNTCQTFGAVAALEARYRRAGITVDLSEEFVNHAGKMMWLHTAWSEITGPNVRENQVGAFGGGGGWAHLRNMTLWMGVPPEAAMPYQPLGYAVDPPTSSHWTQFNTNTFNLDPAVLPRAALHAPAYYRATGYTRIPDPDSRNTAVIESVLRAGHDVCWDFDIRGNRSGSIWRPDGSASGGTHVMLIVGYDRTSSNASNHYFIVKNSWGPTSNPGGFTYISYDYLRQYGIAAGYITGVVTPGPWPEAALLGRRNMCFDGHRGTLDIYHLPGAAQAQLGDSGVTIADRRVGTFRDTAGNMFRVNGAINNNQVVFWFKQSNPNMRWDEQRETPTLGRQFVYLLTELNGDSMAGIHWDNAGSTPNPAYGGYARRPSTINGSSGFLSPRVVAARTGTPEQFLGTWRLLCSNREFELIVDRRDDTALSSTRRLTHAGFRCFTARLGQPRTAVVAEVLLSDPRRIGMQVPDGSSTFAIDALMLNHQPGVFAGRTPVGTSGYSYWAVRLGEHTNGTVTVFGTSCGPLAARPVHSVSGVPELGQTLQFQATGGTPSSVSILALGLSRTSYNGMPLPLSLTVFGAPGCWLYVDPLTTTLVLNNGSGAASVSQRFDIPALLGQRTHSQFFNFASGANSLGVTSSNGVTVLYGGTN